MIKPRIFWVSQHTVLRYEEIPMLIEAGAEVIPCLGDEKLIRAYFDEGYDDEGSIKYPHWRDSCSLNTNIVETLRRTYLLSRWDKLSQQEKDFFNQSIDVMVVASYPEMLASIQEWFQGVILYRVFGPGFNTYTQLFQNLGFDLGNLSANQRYYWSPIMAGLHEPEDRRLAERIVYIPAFVSRERMGVSWLGRKSKPYLSTTLSHVYLPEMQPIYRQFTDLFADLPHIVLGKNAPKDGATEQISGFLDDASFYNQLANSRIYLYPGYGSNYHVHYTPIEAIAMGIPVLYRRESGLAHEARLVGINNRALSRLGMVNDLVEMHAYASEIWQDLDALEELAARQGEIFSQVFSRQRALGFVKKFICQLQPFLAERREKITPVQVEAPEPYQKDYLYRQPSSGLTAFGLDLFPGQRRVLSVESLASLTGAPGLSRKGKRPVHHLDPDGDQPGVAAASYLQINYPGIYRLSFRLDIPLKNGESVRIGSIKFGTFTTHFNLVSNRDIIVGGGGVFDIDMIVEVEDALTSQTQEVQLFWEGNATCDVLEFALERLL